MTDNEKSNTQLTKHQLCKATPFTMQRRGGRPKDDGYAPIPSRRRGGGLPSGIGGGTKGGGVVVVPFSLARRTLLLVLSSAMLTAWLYLAHLTTTTTTTGAIADRSVPGDSTSGDIVGSAAARRDIVGITVGAPSPPTGRDNYIVSVDGRHEHRHTSNSHHLSQKSPPTKVSAEEVVATTESVTKAMRWAPTSYEPTDERRARRVESARASHRRYSRFWRTRAPDPVPPLPPDDADPATGERLPPVVAYVVTLTRCGGSDWGGLDGAAVLLHSIRRNSHGWIPTAAGGNNTSTTAAPSITRPRYGGKGGRYRYRAYAFVDPAASPDIPGSGGDCARFLRAIGYTVLHRASLVPLFEVEDHGHNEADVVDNPFYAEWSKSHVGLDRPVDGPTARQRGEHPDRLLYVMHNDGCCGYAELLKLHVYGLVEHELAVHLDLDSLLLRPMDDLFDAMLGRGGGEEGEEDPHRSNLPLAKLPRTKEVNRTRRIDAVFTRDYNSVKHPGGVDVPVGYQGGFLVVRPNATVLEHFRDILRRGEFVIGPKRGGWGNKVGGFYGDVTFQGILPYYYEYVAPSGAGLEEEGVGGHNEAELDRCVYNQMGDNPRKSTYKFPRGTPLDPDKMVSS